MSEDKDSRLARWSRRKLAARHETDKEVGETVDDTTTEALLSEPALPEGGEPETAEPSEPLPRVEDLTADSDLTAFLKKGVPMALKSAALRKMWSIDPGIRDYVGPAEYAWDFNQPGSMAGFGPLDARETVVSFLSRTVRALEPDAEPAGDQPADAVSEDAGDVPEATGTEFDTPSAVPPTQPSAIRPPTVLAGGEQVASAEAPDTNPDAPTASTVPAPESSRSPNPEPLPRPRHGGAMPR